MAPPLSISSFPEICYLTGTPMLMKEYIPALPLHNHIHRYWIMSSLEAMACGYFDQTHIFTIRDETEAWLRPIKLIVRGWINY